jgi:hypothetical protein
MHILPGFPRTLGIPVHLTRPEDSDCGADRVFPYCHPDWIQLGEVTLPMALGQGKLARRMATRGDIIAANGRRGYARLGAGRHLRHMEGVGPRCHDDMPEAVLARLVEKGMSVTASSRR